MSSLEVFSQDSDDPEPLIVQFSLLKQIVAQQPGNRPARYKLAETAFVLGKHEEARFHLNYLVNSSKSETELRALKRARSQVISADPLSFNLRFALLPSTNIGKTSSETYFLSPDITIEGGGQEESGLGFRIGAGLSVEFTNGLDDIFKLSTSFDRSEYPIDRLDRNQIGLRLDWMRETIKFNSFAQLYLFDTEYSEAESAGSNIRQTGLLLGRSLKLNHGESFSSSFRIEDRDYKTNNRRDGWFVEGTVSYSFSPNPRTKWILGAEIERDMPERNSFVYTGLGFNLERLRRISPRDILGIHIGYMQKNYAGDFELAGYPRQDKIPSVGVSLSSSRLKIYNSTPRLRCTYFHNKSNVSLYRYHSTDCSVSFVRQF